jgi:hypothetical protein
MFSVIDWLSEVNLAAETDLVMMKKSFVDFDFAPSHFSSIQRWLILALSSCSKSAR